MAAITDDTLPRVRQALGKGRLLLASHQRACEPCRTRRPSARAWCPEGWEMHGTLRQWQNMISRMEVIQLEERQLALFDLEPATAPPSER